MNAIDNIQCDVDFEADGKQIGSIDLSYSDNHHAFNKIPIPLVVIKNGKGPTLLLSAGNHGDEYEGQVILRRLIHDLSSDSIQGRLIILPALNYPAVIDNARVSPLDNGNMNRNFPGVENGQPTQAIAAYVTRHILPLSNAGIDLHSGGSSSYYLPSTFICTAKDSEITGKNLDMARTFAAGDSILVDGSHSSSGFDPIANQMGIPFISTELSGGANVDCNAVETGYQGVFRVMHKMGIVDASQPGSETHRIFNCIDGSEKLSATTTAIFEPVCQLGDAVEAGQLAGRLFPLEEIERTPIELRFPQSGIIIVRRNGARVKRGSHLYIVARPFRDEEMARIG
ncbi:MAG: putative deacylase [Gammaproteobacteria bacterium]|jgi:predicted deacylase